jgi:hypothetical protein
MPGVSDSESEFKTKASTSAIDDRVNVGTQLFPALFGQTHILVFDVALHTNLKQHKSG